MEFTQTIRIEDLELFPIEAAGGVSPKMAIGSMPKRPALLLRIRDTDGCYGWGEIWANFPPRAHRHKADIVEDVVTPLLSKVSFTEPLEVQQLLRDKLSVYFLHVGQLHVFEHILAGIDIALWDLALRKHGASAVDYFKLKETTAPCYASSINAEDLDTIIPQAFSKGQKHFKIKIGFQPDLSNELIQRAVKLCPPEGNVMIDSNQSWSFEQAAEMLQSFEPYALKFAEEPILANAPIEQWEKLARGTSIPLAGGENLYGIDQFLTMANAGMSVLQPDVAKWGGISGALALADVLPDNVQLWPHFMGTALGQMASLAVTAVLGGDSVCEVDVNRNPLRTELCGDVMSINNGRICLKTDAGLVTEPTAESLKKYQINFA